MKLITIEEARAQGFTVDTTVYPHVAYKGPRFNPTSTKHCLTELEAQLAKALEAAYEHLCWIGLGDRYERECAREQGLEDQIESALKAAGVET